MRMGHGLAGGLALAALVAAAPARAQPALPQPVIVVVDMTQIMRDSKAAKDVQAQVQKEMDGYSREVSLKENDLKTLRDELERQRTVLAPEVFNARSQDYQQRYAALDHDVQVKRQEMQQSYSDAMTKVENSALQIVADVAKERKATMVVAKAALLYMDDGLDMTAEVTKRLDEKVPSMAVNLPPAAAPPAAPAKPKSSASK
ncbi:MAG TPA: OmpH family outer membrane protein [Stellaceae bacterium]|nr:OmpH family outer membrane protein [Stellaceae bacterium]